MMNLIWMSLILVYSSISFAKDRAPATSLWVPISYEKVILPTRTVEGVIFTKNRNKGKIAYSASYFVGDQVLRTRAIPRGMYLDMTEKLKTGVLLHAKKGFTASCANQILLADGVMNGKTAVDKKITPVCLNPSGKYSRVTEQGFSQWYRGVRTLFDL